MILRWRPVHYNGHTAYQSAVYARTWMSPVHAFVAPPPGAPANAYILLLGVGQ